MMRCKGAVERAGQAVMSYEWLVGREGASVEATVAGRRQQTRGAAERSDDPRRHPRLRVPDHAARPRPVSAGAATTGVGTRGGTTTKRTSGA